MKRGDRAGGFALLAAMGLLAALYVAFAAERWAAGLAAFAALVAGG